MNRNRAFTLVEVLLTLTMGSSLMILAIGLVHQSLSLSKLGKVRGEHDMNVSRLAQQFRQDVHATEAVTATSTDALQLEMLDGSTVVYSTVEAGLRRVHTLREGPNAQDLFTFEPLCSIQFQAHSSNQVVQLQLERRFDDKQIAPRVELQVVARISRWKQLESHQPGAKQ